MEVITNDMVTIGTGESGLCSTLNALKQSPDWFPKPIQPDATCQLPITVINSQFSPNLKM